MSVPTCATASPTMESPEGLQQMLDWYSRDPRRNWGVENNGICLLITWSAGLVQQIALRDLDECSNCDRTGWVCETHPNRPFKMFSKRADACECRGAGVPCPVCNTGETDVPAAGIQGAARLWPALGIS